MNTYKSPAELFFDYHKDREPNVSQVLVGELWSVDEFGGLNVDPNRFTATVTVRTGGGAKSIEALGSSATDALINIAKQIGSDWRG